jgi:hypothetical protein
MNPKPYTRSPKHKFLRHVGVYVSPDIRREIRERGQTIICECETWFPSFIDLADGVCHACVSVLSQNDIRP